MHDNTEELQHVTELAGQITDTLVDMAAKDPKLTRKGQENALIAVTGNADVYLDRDDIDNMKIKVSLDDVYAEAYLMPVGPHPFNMLVHSAQQVRSTQVGTNSRVCRLIYAYGRTDASKGGVMGSRQMERARGLFRQVQRDAYEALASAGWTSIGEMLQAGRDGTLWVYHPDYTHKMHTHTEAQVVNYFLAHLQEVTDNNPQPWMTGYPIQEQYDALQSLLSYIIDFEMWEVRPQVLDRTARTQDSAKLYTYLEFLKYAGLPCRSRHCEYFDGVERNVFWVHDE